MRADIKAWAKDNIVWAGNANTNRSGRRNHAPEVIVDHIVEGTAASCIDWFTNPGNKESSAHFLVSQKGKVYQFVAIEDNAWANGLTDDQINDSLSPVVRSKPGINPNWYSVSIEHEGIYRETRGAITQAQLKASIMLHAYIMGYVKDTWGVEITPDVDHILGHSVINPVEKPHCPGELFPFQTIIKEVGGIAENLPFSDISDHWAKEIILEALELGIVKGDNSPQFKPDRPSTRAEVVTMVMNMYKKLKG